MSCEVSKKVLTLHILCEIFQDKISDKDRPHPLHMNGVEQIPLLILHIILKYKTVVIVLNFSSIRSVISDHIEK